MEDLSFGEQVKIILSRKGMTIKELAEQIEATTKKKMSRQNLTQRLGRDNFQEKDMRMIAAILGCPFQLSIFPLENGAGEKAEPMEELLLKYVKHPKVQPKKKKDGMEDGYYQQVLVFDQDSPGIAASDADGEAVLDAGVPGMMSDADRESVSDADVSGMMSDTDKESVSDAGAPGAMPDADKESVSDASAAGAMADADRESSSDADTQDKTTDPGREAASDIGREGMAADTDMEALSDTEVREAADTTRDSSVEGTSAVEREVVTPAGVFDPFAADSDFDEDDDLLEIDILDPEDSEDLDEADLLYGGFKTKRIDRAAILAAARKAEEEKWDAITGTRGRTEEAQGQEFRIQGTAAAGTDGAEENYTPDALRQSDGAERINAAGEERRPEVQGAGTDHSTEARGAGADRSSEISGDAVGADRSMESQYRNDAPKAVSGDREDSGAKEQDFDRKAAAEKEPTAAEERDLTIGELYMIHKELDELEETLHPREDVSMEIPAQAAPSDPEPIYAAGQEEPEEDPEPEDFEPVIRYEDAEENLELGEMNPYTGREYQTNSVRMHPSRIGYVQVYDRFQHGWTDMTEWAFLGYQERKKTLLGRDYEPPIYLD